MIFYFSIESVNDNLNHILIIKAMYVKSFNARDKWYDKMMQVYKLL